MQWNMRAYLPWAILKLAYLSECHLRNSKRLLWVLVRLVGFQGLFVWLTPCIVSENKPVGSTRGGKEVHFNFILSLLYSRHTLG